MNLTKPYLPQPVDDVTLAFPAMVEHLMPAWEDIPDDYKGTNEYSDFLRQMLFTGLNYTYFAYLPAKVDADAPGGETLEDEDDAPRLDGEEIWRHLSAIAGSFEPKHQHKEAAITYLCSLWMQGMIYGPKDCGPEDLKMVGDYPVETIEQWVEHVNEKEVSA